MGISTNFFLKDLKGIITKPGETLGKLMKEKKWVPTFLLILSSIFILTYISVPLQISKLSQYPQIPEEYLGIYQNNPTLFKLMTAATAAFILFIKISVGAFFVYLFFGIGGSDGIYSNYFSLVVNTSIIDTLIPSIINMFSLLAGYSLLESINLAFLIPGLDPESLSYVALSHIELFSVWYIVAIAAGVAAFANMKFKKSLSIGILYFTFKASISIAFSHLFMNMFRT